MQVLEHMKCILETMRPYFTQDRVFRLFQTHIVSNLEMPGRHTISNVVCFKGADDKDWTRDYRLFSTSHWDVTRCMNTVLQEGLKELPSMSFIPLLVDLTSLRKHGKKIPYTNYQVDPLSPPFRKGLMWGQRFLHASLLIPMHQHSLPSRSIPVRLEMAPYVKKPGKRASEMARAAYKEERKRNNANVQTMKLMKELRDVCNHSSIKKILMIADGGFCNKHCFRFLPENVDLLTRCRKDAKLCYQSKTGRSFYGVEKFTPEQVRVNPEIPWHKSTAFYGGDWRDIQYKELTNIYWQRGAERRQLRLIVIKPMPYRKTGSGYDNYRDPCYLLTTDLTTHADELIQAYLDRPEIEQNHRDMKNSLGLGEAQVWSEVSVSRHPQTIMLAYSVLLLATLRACGPTRTTDYLPPPKWYKGRLRPTIEDMRRRLRQELNTDSDWREYYGIRVPWGIATANLVA